jgi:hypothetical protein
MKPEKKRQPTNPQYCRFTETNEYEGETWHFYIPVKGNEDALIRLQDQLERVSAFYSKGEEMDISDLGYSLSQKTYTRDQVQFLMDEDDEGIGYMRTHNRLTGYLSLPKLSMIIDEVSARQWEEHFYKGGIVNLMQRRKTPAKA